MTLRAKQLAEVPARLINMKDLLFTGGHEGWAADIMMSSLDHDNDGLLDEKDMRLYLKSGEKMVDAFKGFAETNGIVGALILSVVYPLALQQEIEHFDFCFLEDDSNGSAGAATATLSRHEVRRVYLQTAAVVMLSIACILALALVIFSARIHTQISFWMPNLESKVWYAQRNSKTLLHLETAKTCLVFLALLALLLFGIARAWWFGVMTGIPTFLLVVWYWRFEYRQSCRCAIQLEEQTRMVLREARTLEAQAAKHVLSKRYASSAALTSSTSSAQVQSVSA